MSGNGTWGSSEWGGSWGGGGGGGEESGGWGSNVWGGGGGGGPGNTWSSSSADPWGGGHWHWRAAQMTPAPAAPPALPPGDEDGNYWKGYGKGWQVGYSMGYATAAQAYEEFMQGGKGKGAGKAGKRALPEAEAEEEQTAASSKPKRKKKPSEAWKEWYDTYTIHDTEKSRDPYFYTRLGPKEISVYPTEIQEPLRAAFELASSGTSHSIEYDMTGGYIYKLRIFGGEEKEAWVKKLSEIKSAEPEEGTSVGAQWDISKDGDPPRVFGEKVRYRPTFISDNEWSLLGETEKK